MLLEERKSPDWISTFEKFCENDPAPKPYATWTAIATLSGALSRRTWIRTLPSKWLCPNLYIMLVGAPATGKSIIDLAARLWRGLPQVNVGPESLSGASLADALHDTPGLIFPQPTITRTVTPPEEEAVHDLCIAAEEFGHFLRGDPNALLYILNRIYTAPDAITERIRRTGRELYVSRPNVTLLAGAPPASLGKIFPPSAFKEGFLSRVILVYAEKIRFSFMSRVNGTDARLWRDLVHDLDQIGRLSGEIKLEPGLFDIIAHWHDHLAGHEELSHPSLAHYNTRRPLHALKLAMTCMASRTNNLYLTHKDWERGLDFLRAAETNMPIVCERLTEKDFDAALIECKQFCQRQNGTIQEHEIYAFLSQRVPTYQIESAIDALVRMRCIDRVGDTDSRLPMELRDRAYRVSGEDSIGTRH